MSLNSIGKRGKRVPMVIKGPLLLVALGLPIYWWIAESGLYYYFREVQVDLTGGSFVPLLTVLLSMLILLIPVLILVQLLAGFFPKNGPKDVMGN